MTPLRSVCVFCGSSPGVDGRHADAARDFGARLARRGLTLVYGGARRGLMGALADAALEDGGRVTGIIPRGLWAREVGHTGLSELLVVDTMHERKALMAERADAFVALPGGAGTLEELFEAWTWAMLGIHAKPVAVLDVDGFFAPLLAMVDHMTEAGFVRAAHRQMLLVDDDADRLLARLAAYEPPAVERWLTPDEQ
ncbi:TIGR00730 family Rossman fold protein [Roseisolibacter sp. H3M3-2]|uniref:LOG family protein n=1 Tax=Roseisolibacter sp. H3M3-2 TaxID=3031323 RepID=UPI0023DB2022|nr:TIGR00730 family Rossman fold protein [Roseisolibacter sp. H3M3-2]MDF1503376.1 TIGR00730 family Rossman fold protein [Roseisolibacter sp. H3M3-2]